MSNVRTAPTYHIPDSSSESPHACAGVHFPCVRKTCPGMLSDYSLCKVSGPPAAKVARVAAPKTKPREKKHEVRLPSSPSLHPGIGG